MWGRPMKLHAILCALLYMTVACSGGDEPEEPVKAESEADAEAEVDAPAEDGSESEVVEDAEDAPVEEVTSAPTSEPAGFDGPKVWKYVTSFALNVRGAPDKDNSTVIRHVKWGDKVEVVVNGDWAKLGEGEYISAKFLSDTDPALKKNRAVKKKGQ